MRIEEFKAMIQEIVTEELDNMLLTEARERLKRGQSKSKRTGRTVYTSAGTLPSSQPDKAGRPARSKVDPAKRDAIGKKLFNLYQRGDKRGGTKSKDQKAVKFRDLVDRTAADQYGGTPTAKEKYSVIWSQASLRSRIASNIDNEAPGSKAGRTRIKKPGSRERKDAAAETKRKRIAEKEKAKAEKLSRKKTGKKKSTPPPSGTED